MNKQILYKVCILASILNDIYFTLACLVIKLKNAIIFCIENCDMQIGIKTEKILQKVLLNNKQFVFLI